MNAYRQAAIVVASLDRSSADDLLERLPDEQARAIRDELVLLDELDRDEQLGAIEGYLGTPVIAQPEVSCEINDLSNTATHAKLHIDASPAKPRAKPSSAIEELLGQEDSSIANALHHERSSIVAALLHYLPQKRAAGVLRLLPPDLQWRVLTNLNQGHTPSAEIVDVIADRICEKQAEQKTNSSNRPCDALQAIFNELPRNEQREMLRSLAKENPMLAQRLVPVDSPSSRFVA